MKKIISLISCMALSILAYADRTPGSGGSFQSGTDTPSSSTYSDQDSSSLYRSNRYDSNDRTSNRNANTYLNNTYESSTPGTPQGSMDSTYTSPYGSTSTNRGMGGTSSPGTS